MSEPAITTGADNQAIRTSPQPWTGERASATVEFALVLPLVLSLMLALLQIGLLVKDRLVLEGAARSGAREATVNRDDEAVRNVASNAAVSLDPGSLEVSVTREGGTGSPSRRTGRRRRRAITTTRSSH